MNPQKIIQRAQIATSESKHLDFKQEFDATSSEAWCGLVKDIVAFANSDGGAIVFGVSDDGTPSGIDVGAITAIDSSEFTNKILKYTGYQFSDFEFVSVVRGGITFPMILIYPADIPLVFTKPGTYEIPGGKQKTAFSQGTVYFRHGSKSEPGNRDDLQKWHTREIAKARRGWLTGIRKVVEAPPGQIVSVLPVSSPQSGHVAMSGKLTNDPNATAFVPTNAEEIWPYRQKDVLKKINSKLPPSSRINGHDIYCINRVHEVLSKKPMAAYKPHKLASPQYSDEFVNWVVDQFQKDQNFFHNLRQEMKKRGRESQKVASKKRKP